MMFEQTMKRLPAALNTMLALTAACLLLTACSDQGSSSPAATESAAKPAAADTPAAPATDTKPVEAEPTPSPEDLAKRGRSVYMANCIACHSPNPAQDGALGPAVAGASRELIEARVMRSEYPDGYTPKRPSKVMIALPHLGGEIDALTAYLASGS